MALNFQNNGATPKRGVLLVILLALSLIAVTLYAREGEGGPLHVVQGAVSQASQPFRFVGAQVGAGAQNAASGAADATASEDSLTALREQNAELTQLVAQAEEYRKEAERLEGLLGLKQSSGAEGVAARVVGRSTDSWNQTVTIDAGSSAGITTGLTVMGSNGVVGQVVSVTSGTSVVRLLTDPQSGAAALVQSSRAEGVVRGSLDGLLYLENIDADVQVSVGDVVLTSGLGGSYTRGLLIGTVVKVEGSQSDESRRIVVSPNEAAGPLEEVVVVTSATGSSTSDSSASSQGSNDSNGEGGAN